jgi:hypothetical protein
MRLDDPDDCPVIDVDTAIRPGQRGVRGDGRALRARLERV